MTPQITIEIFSAGCPVCDETVALVNDIATESAAIRILDMNDPAVGARAKQLGIRSVPAVAVNGRLADCCAGRGVDAEVVGAALRASD